MNKKPKRTVVLCIEGCHGTGKTSICNWFQKCGFEILDEGFMKSYQLNLHPQSFIMEHQWITSWFTRILSKCNYNEEKYYVVDRSPFSSVFYTRGKGEIFQPLINELIKEVKEKANVEIFTICLLVNKDILWKRISERLEREPERKKYGEDCREWMENIYDKYEKFPHWDVQFPNSKKTNNFNRIINSMIKAIEKKRKIKIPWCKPITGKNMEKLQKNSILVK